MQLQTFYRQVSIPLKMYWRHVVILSYMFHVFNQSVSSKIMHALDNQPVAVRLKGLVTIFYYFVVGMF